MLGKNEKSLLNNESAEERFDLITESGILLENGELLSTGKVVEIAQMCKQLLERGDVKGFQELMRGPAWELDDNEKNLLANAVITENGNTVLETLVNYQYSKGTKRSDDTSDLLNKRVKL